ncbi:MAG: hypothetical protein JJE40_09025, partial [Vicinamibacteria bacterium]|nr:hypothetical protein [Vicinamibacteria bacterium]
AGKPVSKMIEEDADIYAFIFKALGIDVVSGFSRTLDGPPKGGRYM